MISNKDTIEIELQEQFIANNSSTKTNASSRLSAKHIIVFSCICLLVVVGAILIALYVRTRSSPTVHDDWHIEFVTDIEGHYEYFQNIVNHSKVIKFGKPDHGQPVLEWMSGMETKGYFVVGGDTVDRGIGDMRMVTSLVAFKLKYPQRVIFIIGNRDFNKLRLQRELNGPLIDTEILIDEYQGYRGNSGRISDDKLAEFRACYGKNATKTLKWLLANTMGAPKAFENRKIELAELGRKHENEDVIRSYLQSMDPTQGEEAFMWNYINNAVFVWQFGEHLFMHGPYGYMKGSIGEWLDRLKAIRHDIQFQYANEPSRQFNFSYFRRIVEDDLKVYNQDFRFFVPTRHFNGTPFGQPSLQLFYGEGDALYGMNVYHGHIPAGQDTPTVMITPHNALPYYLTNADTSYGCFRTDEDRGGSYANTLITSNGIHVEGRTAVDNDGKCQTISPSKHYQFTVPFTTNYDEVVFDKHIGTIRNIDDENKLVKFKINDTKNEYVTQILTEEADANGRVHLHALFGLCTYQ
eukprot:690872_1